jgi:hypothetical protein
MSVAVIRAAFSISSQKHLGQVPESNRPIRAIRPSRFQPFPPRCNMPRPYDNAMRVTVHAPTAERVHNTRHAHCAERDSPDHCSPTSPDGRNSAMTIAIAGSQYRRETRHRLDRMSRDLQVVALESTLPLRFQGYSKIWSSPEPSEIAVE